MWSAPWRRQASRSSASKAATTFCATAAIRRVAQFVPVHQGKDIKRGLLRKIISDAGLTVEEFRAFL
jgi:hypothetical protein